MSQSLSNVILHVIFSTKDRYPFIDKDIEKELYAYIISIAASFGSYVYRIGGVNDHIHLLITLPRTFSISQLLEQIKKNSSKWIKTKDKKYHMFAWQRGFGVFSVSVSQQQGVVNYIENQKQHHQTLSFQDEYRKFLQLNNISYDERYVWD